MIPLTQHDPSKYKGLGIPRKRRIIIIDDDPDITKTFSLVLEDSGLYEVETFNNPSAALRSFRPDYYDLALLDIRMPNINGFALSEKMEKIDKKAKICFISAFDIEDKVLREQYPSLEVKSFLPKSIAINVLLGRLEVELLR
jgi:DNA-binding NtrC family response regulator